PYNFARTRWPGFGNFIFVRWASIGFCERRHNHSALGRFFGTRSNLARKSELCPGGCLPSVARHPSHGGGGQKPSVMARGRVARRAAKRTGSGKLVESPDDEDANGVRGLVAEPCAVPQRTTT